MITTSEQVDARGLAIAIGCGVVVRDNGTTSEVEWDDPAVLEATVLAAIGTHPADPVPVNKAVIEQALRDAIATNSALLAQVQAGQTMATNMQTISIPNVATAQTWIRNAGTLHAGTITAAAAALQQLTKLARLMLGELDATNGA